jgi:hypothetical protein
MQTELSFLPFQSFEMTHLLDDIVRPPYNVNFKISLIAARLYNIHIAFL